MNRDFRLDDRAAGSTAAEVHDHVEQALSEGFEQVNRLAKLKKADIASEAERLADGTGWMPAIFKAAVPQDAAQEAGTEQDAPEDAEAMADEPAEALAA